MLVIKREIYPKTRRADNNVLYQITEKLDGSNLCFIKWNSKLYIAQRSNIFTLDDIVEHGKGLLYKGLREFLDNHGKQLEEAIYEGSVVCGEWLGMGQIKYQDVFPSRFNMFAKARISNLYTEDKTTRISQTDGKIKYLDYEEIYSEGIPTEEEVMQEKLQREQELIKSFKLVNIQYDVKNFSYCFNEQLIPDYVGIVPVVSTQLEVTIEDLDKLYDEYCAKVGRDVEGFVINRNHSITKYVRHKNGKPTEHKMG